MPNTKKSPLINLRTLIEYIINIFHIKMFFDLVIVRNLKRCIKEKQSNGVSNYKNGFLVLPREKRAC